MKKFFVIKSDVGLKLYVYTEFSVVRILGRELGVLYIRN